MQSDLHFLQHAVRVGVRAQGRTWPNPAVGCVLVKDGAVIAAASDADSGRPHAETEALAIAGDLAKGSTAYVSLEPCSHHGKTPPCAEALIAAKIARVVIGAIDPNPEVNGKGIEMLRKANIDVTIQELPEARALARGFFRRMRHGLPYVAMKLATSMDGYMARKSGEKWITGEAARRHAHGVRARVDAVLTGIGTVLADDPELTARNPGADNPRLVRVVADRSLRLPVECKLVKTAKTQPTWVITSTKAVEYAASHATELREKGVTVIAIEDEILAPLSILKALAVQGITRVLIESGPAIATNFLAANAVDTLYWYRAPFTLAANGAAGMAPIEGLVPEANRKGEPTHLALGADHCDLYEIASCLPD